MYQTLVLITAYSLFIACRYIYRLGQDTESETHIMWDSLHTLQHIAIVGMSAILSIAMLFWDQSGYEILTHIFYNATLIFIVYPHLTSEK